MPRRRIIHYIVFATPVLALTAPVYAQEAETPAAKRTRIIAGPQLSPAWPGAKDLSVGPYFDLSREREGTEFTFEAADESFGAPLLEAGAFAFGPALGFVGKRSAADVGANLPKVGLTIEAGGFAQVSLTPNFRLRAEARKGLGGHGGFVGEVSADYVVRDGDDWLFSVGPRVTLGDGKYQRAYFGVSPTAAVASGLPAYDIDGGVHAVGLTAGYLRQLSPDWGLAAYARYDRLVGDAAISPVVRQLGTRDQPSVGLAVSYTFGGNR